MATKEVTADDLERVAAYLKTIESEATAANGGYVNGYIKEISTAVRVLERMAFEIVVPDDRYTAKNIKCVVVKQEQLVDYWTIERAEHDGRSWMQPLGRNCSALCVSARLGEPSADSDMHNNADIEGDSREMLAIAQAIETGGAASFNRCEAVTTEDGVALMSPRNMRFPVVITHECAKALAADIRAKVKG